tara:strand:- start:10086 stop:10352 length:267 start_codon:yes stop_codon:yes gene_type:complete
VKDERTIARIPRNASDELVIRTANFWNIDIIDMRWYKNGEPTRKGLRVNMEEGKTLLKAIRKAIGDNDDNKQQEVEYNEQEPSEEGIE